MTTQIDITHLAQWVGREETRQDLIAAFPSNALAATLDRDDPAYGEGTALPPLYHWLHFLDVHKRRDTNYDGHAKLGGFMPPVPLPRRMWAGSRLRFLAPLRIGHMLERRSRIASVKHKAGRSGDLVFVTVEHAVYDGDVQGLAEEHDIVYRAAPGPGAPQTEPPRAPADSTVSRLIEPDPVLLFRYSALTFNGHRIHYDHPFCTGTEGYDGLVVHGPLLATLMLDLVRREWPGARVTGFEFRAVSPVFDTHPFAVHGRRDGNRVALWVARQDGALAMQGAAEIDT